MKSKNNGAHSGIVLGSWQVNPEIGQLVDNQGKDYFLEPRLMKLLVKLLQNSNQIITREALIQYIWEDVIVNEESLTKAIFDLRKFLKTHLPNQAEIVTIRKVGYKLIIKESRKKKKSILKALLRAALYTFLALAFFVMLIRAINY